MPTKQGSGDSAVYNRPLGGGEAIDDDVEGHSMKLQAASGLKPRARARVSDSGDEDTEGHSMKLAATTGLKPRARARVSDSGDDDTEGHSRAR
jgi:phage terminase small subunit